MGFAKSPDIFQLKTNYSFHGFEFICSYRYSLLVLEQEDWTEYEQKLEFTLNKLQEKDLNIALKSVSSENPTFVLVTQYVVKLTDKNIQAKNNIKLPNSQK